MNETKLQAGLETTDLRLASAETVRRVFGVESGFIGPVSLLNEIRIVADLSVVSGENWISGANEADKHLKNINLERDFQISDLLDIAFAVAGDICPRCEKGRLEEYRGIEVGHVFYLGTKYSEAMDCRFLDEKGQSLPAEMGCYGIGVGRTMAAAIEQNHDDNGMKWPIPIAPWEVVILPLHLNDGAVAAAAETIYAELCKAKIDVVVDDRDERPGFKFKDADLIGYPLQVVLGSKSVSNGKAELKYRQTGERAEIPLSEAAGHIVKWVLDARITA
ncbi:MAG: hypothetical protein B6D68_00135 [spirochete symbiont of Stewartia floridana]|nr:MAG: hypothetical protein B6D68_00135 [spirochete symbiont of Stewartia floridana]